MHLELFFLYILSEWRIYQIYLLIKKKRDRKKFDEED